MSICEHKNCGKIKKNCHKCETGDSYYCEHHSNFLHILNNKVECDECIEREKQNINDRENTLQYMYDKYLTLNFSDYYERFNLYNCYRNYLTSQFEICMFGLSLYNVTLDKIIFSYDNAKYVPDPFKNKAFVKKNIKRKSK